MNVEEYVSEAKAVAEQYLKTLDELKERESTGTVPGMGVFSEKTNGQFL